MYSFKNDQVEVKLAWVHAWLKQKEFINIFDDDVALDICLYQGGYGSGKTWVAALLGLALAQKYPGTLGLVVAKTYSLLRDTTEQMYLEHMNALGMVEGVDYIYLRSEAKLMFPCFGNSRILFRSMQEPGKIKSITASWVHVEEMSELTEADFNMLLSRARDPNCKRRRVFGTTNPQGTRGWIYKTFVLNSNNNEPIDVGGEKIQYRRLISPTTDNKALPPGYIESMRNQFDPEYFRMFVLGEDGDYSVGMVVKHFSGLNLMNTLYRPDQPIYIGCDFNVDPMCWVLFHRYNDEFHYFDEIVMENTTTLEAVDEFARRYPDHTGEIIITGDASGHQRATQAARANSTNYTLMRNRLSELGYRRVGLNVKSSNPPVSDRVSVWNAMICNHDGVRRIFINPVTCPKLVWNCENLRYIQGTSRIWEPGQREREKNRDYKFYKHIWDAASYAVERYNPIRIQADAIGKKHQFVSVPFQPDHRNSPWSLG